MTTYTWTSTSGGSWSQSGSWQPGTAYPSSPSDFAVIGGSLGTNTITFDGSGTIGGITMNDAGGDLLFAGNTATISSSVLLSAGTITITSGGISNRFQAASTAVINGGYLIQSGGAFGATKGINVTSGVVQFNGGSVSTGGSLYISGGTLLDGGANISLSKGAEIAGGSVTLSGGTLSVVANTFTVDSGQSVAMSGGYLLANTGGVANSGTVSGYGTINGNFSGSGTAIASAPAGETLDLQGTVSGQALRISDHSVLELDATPGSGNSATFTGTTFEVLQLTTQSNGSLNVNQFISGDTIIVSGATAATVTNNNTLVFTNSSGTLDSLVMDRNYTQGQITNQGGGSFTTTNPCFASGSHIRTDQGDIPVEQLSEGQLVAVLRDGGIAFTPITWIGQRRINLRAHPHPQTAAPVRIRRGAIGENLPRCDLVLSPDHCLFIDRKLIPAKSLINGMTIVQERWLPSVHYFHVEVDPHAVLLAEDLPVESYLDTGNRAYFENAGAALVLHPEFTINAGLKTWETHACAPLTVAPEAVYPIWRRLAERAEALGFVAPQLETTLDPDLHIVAAGRTIRPTASDDGRYLYALPAGCSSVRLISRATIPSDLAAYLDDWRPLGVAVVQLEVRTGTERQVIPADHPSLVYGWHSLETDGITAWRWTAGNAELKLEAVEGSAILEVRVCNTARYLMETAPQEKRRAAA